MQRQVMVEERIAIATMAIQAPAKPQLVADQDIDRQTRMQKTEASRKIGRGIPNPTQGPLLEPIEPIESKMQRTRHAME